MKTTIRLSLLSFFAIAMFSWSICGCSNTSQPANNKRQVILIPQENNESKILEAIDRIATSRGLKKVTVVGIEKSPLVYQDPENQVQQIIVTKSDNRILVDCKSMPPAMVQSGIVLKPFHEISKLDEHFEVKIEKN